MAISDRSNSSLARFWAGVLAVTVGIVGVLHLAVHGDDQGRIASSQKVQGRPAVSLPAISPVIDQSHHESGPSGPAIAAVPPKSNAIAMPAEKDADPEIASGGPQAEPVARHDRIGAWSESARQIAAVDAPPSSVAKVLTFRGPVMNETMQRGGQLTLQILRHGNSDIITVEFRASAGLVGTGELTGTISGDGQISAAGRLLMGRNPFDCVLRATSTGGTLTGGATFIHVGSTHSARSTFTLARRT